MSLLGKKFPGAMGMCFLDPEIPLWERSIWTNELTYLSTYSQAFDSLLRCRYAYKLDIDCPDRPGADGLPIRDILVPNLLLVGHQSDDSPV